MPPLGPVPASRLLSLHHSNGQQLGSPDTSLAEMSWGLTGAGRLTAMRKRTHSHSRLDRLFNISLNENSLCLLPAQTSHSHHCPCLLLAEARQLSRTGGRGHQSGRMIPP